MIKKTFTIFFYWMKVKQKRRKEKVLHNSINNQNVECSFNLFYLFI
jgi:hypothetical protein